MAFASTGLVSASNQQNDSLPRVYTYATASDNKATVLANNYWAANPQRLKAGDWVLCSCSNGGLAVYVVSASTSASVVTTTAPA